MNAIRGNFVFKCCCCALHCCCYSDVTCLHSQFGVKNTNIWKKKYLMHKIKLCKAIKIRRKKGSVWDVWCAVMMSAYKSVSQLVSVSERTSSCNGLLWQSKQPHLGPQNFNKAKQSQYLSSYVAYFMIPLSINIIHVIRWWEIKLIDQKVSLKWVLEM